MDSELIRIFKAYICVKIKMMRALLIITFISVFFLSSCKVTDSVGSQNKLAGWFNVAVSEEFEIYTDTLSIRKDGAMIYAREKKVFKTVASRSAYIDKIKKTYMTMGKPEKANKWADFSYCIYSSAYDCLNKRFKILSVEDYDSDGNLILKTTTPVKSEKWTNVDVETVADYTFFFVCDFQK